MPNELPLPPDMQHLLEKRSGEERRGSSGEPDAADGRDAVIAPTDTETAAADDSPNRRKTDRRSED